jgi:hypothetical protein
VLLRRELAGAARLVAAGFAATSARRLAASWLGRRGRFYLLRLETGACVATDRLPVDFALFDGEPHLLSDAFGRHLLAPGWSVAPGGHPLLLVADSVEGLEQALENGPPEHA